jgi:hypothetical protein
MSEQQKMQYDARKSIIDENNDYPEYDWICPAIGSSRMNMYKTQCIRRQCKSSIPVCKKCKHAAPLPTLKSELTEILKGCDFENN